MRFWGVTNQLNNNWRGCLEICFHRFQILEGDFNIIHGSFEDDLSEHSKWDGLSNPCPVCENKSSIISSTEEETTASPREQ